jgi:hypothetical protein
MSVPFFDSAQCAETFHEFRRTEKGIEVFHSNDEPCAVSEYFLPLSSIAVDDLREARRMVEERILQ